MRRGGGDRWYNARPASLNFRVAAALHRLGTADAKAIAAACNIPWSKAYATLAAIAKRPHLYHVAFLGRGLFAARVGGMRRNNPRQD